MAFRGSLQDIRLFVAAYEEGSFTAAAVREGCTQSGVSHHVRQLEMLLNVRLFNRDKAKVTTTPAADDYYRHCVQLLRSLDKATDGVSRFAEGHQGTFTVGVVPALAHRIIAPALLRFAEIHPNVKVGIVESYSVGLSSMVASSELDFAIGTIHGPEAGVRMRSLLSSPECLISRKSIDGAAATPAQLRDDGPHNIVWATGMQARRNAIEAWFAANGIQIDTSIDINSSLVTLDMVGRSAWKTVTPAIMLDPATDANRFEAVPLVSPSVSLDITLIERMSSEMPREAQDFVEIVVEEAVRINNAWTDIFRSRGLEVDKNEALLGLSEAS